ncbi:SWIM zinc finger family protein [Pyxidicoccus fallax]|nr:SWIM zinc finger family protein [Pyxidicoccus fallax]
MFFDEGFPEYVSAAERRRRAARELEKLRRKGGHASPVVVEGRALARTVWGKAWCESLESFSDLANRLPRGRSYVRNGQVVHLEVAPGKVKARVHGTELYEVAVEVKPLPGARWRRLVKACAGQVSSVMELLGGRLSEPVMEVLCRPGEGLFPLPKELSFSCTCPDDASMCKHVAAALYGMGARLDTAPELLFTLRQVNGAELVTGAAEGLARGAPASGATLEQGSDLAGLFGIELAHPDARAEPPPRGRDGAARKVAAKKPRAKKAVAKAPKKQPVEKEAGRKQGPGSRKGTAKSGGTRG